MVGRGGEGYTDSLLLDPDGPAGVAGEAQAQKPRRRSPEHSFQAWADRLLDRVVMPPMFTTAIDHAAADMAHIGRRAALQGRGVKFGLPDVFVCQAAQDGGSSAGLWIELKRGSRVSSAQEGVHTAMRRAGQSVAVCSSMAGIVAALRNYGFDVHGNADALAAEYEARVAAKERAPAVVRKPHTGKPRAARYTGRGITTAMQVGLGARR